MGVRCLHQYITCQWLHLTNNFHWSSAQLKKKQTNNAYSSVTIKECLLFYMCETTTSTRKISSSCSARSCVERCAMLFIVSSSVALIHATTSPPSSQISPSSCISPTSTDCWSTTCSASLVLICLATHIGKTDIIFVDSCINNSLLSVTPTTLKGKLCVFTKLIVLISDKTFFLQLLQGSWDLNTYKTSGPAMSFRFLPWVRDDVGEPNH